MTPKNWRAHGVFFALFGAAALVRLYGLSWAPSPAGDEGTWAALARDLLHGVPADLPADARFVTLAFAQLLSASMAYFGESFFSLRLVGVCFSLLAVLVSYAIGAALQQRRAGLVIAAVLAFHPWSVLWSRTAATPYPIALALITIGLLLLWAGLLQKRATAVALGIFVIAFSAHFSPLVILTAFAVGLRLVQKPHRWIFRRSIVLLALGAGLLQALPVLLQASSLARSTPLAQHTGFAESLVGYVHMITTGLLGEATLRHFTGAALPYGLSWVAALAVLAIVLEAHRVRASSLGLLGVAVLGMPLVLLPARDWGLTTLDRDRYLFVLLPGFAMALSSVMIAGSRFAKAAALVVLLWICGGTARTGWAMLRGGSQDHGVVIGEGAQAYRGWLVAAQHQPTVELICDAALSTVGDQPATILTVDPAFRTLPFALLDSRLVAQDWRKKDLIRQSGPTFIVLWSPGLLLPGYEHWGSLEDNNRLRHWMHQQFPHAKKVREFAQPDGSPLLEVWFAY